MASTLLLDPPTWDLLLDASGNWALATDPYSQAQDAASAIRTFRGEVYYDQLAGMPYWENILGQAPPLSIVRAEVIAQALTVPGVAAAKCAITRFKDRHLQGQVQIVNSAGQAQVLGF